MIPRLGGNSGVKLAPSPLPGPTAGEQQRLPSAIQPLSGRFRAARRQSLASHQHGLQMPFQARGRQKVRDRRSAVRLKSGTHLEDLPADSVAAKTTQRV